MSDDVHEPRVDRHGFVSAWTAFGILAGIYALLVIAFNASIPLFEAPDEPSHLEYVVFLAEEGRLPSYGRRPDVPGEGMQPPLYYVTALPFYLAVDDPKIPLRAELHQVNASAYHAGPLRSSAAVAPNRHVRPAPRGGSRRFQPDASLAGLRVVRLASLGFGLLAVLLTGAALMRATGDVALALLAACIVAFNPQFLFVSAAISNDTAAAAIGAGALLLVAMAIDGRTPTRRLYLATALLGALGLATKTTTLPALVVSGLVVWHCDHRALKDRASDLTWAGVVFSVLGGPLLVFNTLDRGDPIGSAAIWESAAHLPRPDHWGGVVPWLTTRYGQWTFESYWARFGWFDLTVPRWVLWPYAVLVAGGVWGAIRIVRDESSANEIEEDEGTQRPTPLRARARRMIPGTAAAVAATIAVHLWLNLHVAQAQGRHLFAVAPQLAALIALGWSRLLPRHTAGRPWETLVIPSAMLLLAVFCLLAVIRPAYA